MSAPCAPLTPDLRVVLAFANTLGFDPPGDDWSDPSVARGWLAEHDLPAGPADEGELAHLRAFRGALRAVLEANAGHGSREAAWGQVEPFAREAPLYIAPGETPVLSPAGSGLQATIGTVLASVYDALRAGTWRRLKLCREESCRWAYYDQSKNGSGAWCSMRICGNRNKARRRRERERPTS